MSAPFPDGLLRWTGDWSPTTLYRYGDIVLASTNVSYVCGVPTSLNQNPVPAPSASWAPFPSSGGAAPQVYQATYYNSVAQTLISGDTDITFDKTAPWNNTGGYITHTNGTKNFTVVQTGVYQLDFNAFISANGATWGTGANKIISIDITRSPTLEQAVITQSYLVATTVNYSQIVTTTFYLVAGDVINLRLSGFFAGGPPTALGVVNTIDLNTFFTWRYIAPGGATGVEQI